MNKSFEELMDEMETTLPDGRSKHVQEMSLLRSQLANCHTEIKRLQSYVDAFRREEKRADDLGRNLDDFRAKAIEAIESAAVWCGVERQKLGAIDGYDYRSGEEYGLRRAEIEIARRVAALSRS